MSNRIEFIPYGEVSSRLGSDRWRTVLRNVQVSKRRESAGEARRCVFVTFSQDLDETFVHMFRERGSEDARVLIFNEGGSADRLLSRLIDLQIRTPQRCYVVEAKFGCGKSHSMALIAALLRRFASGLKSDVGGGRILNATIEDGVLRVVSPEFDRLEVALAEIPDFKDADPAAVQEFEIDEDGAFIYWPRLDVHLGWAQLQQVVNPQAALRASQKSAEFNERYGRAVRKFREGSGVRASDVAGLSEKQLGRIERGECRLTSNAIEALAKAHKLNPNDYMEKLARAVGGEPEKASIA